MNVHRVDNLPTTSGSQYYLGRLYPWLKWWLFFRWGFFNGGSEPTRRRLICWFGFHYWGENAWLSWPDKQDEEYSVEICTICEECGFQNRITLKDSPLKVPDLLKLERKSARSSTT